MLPSKDVGVFIRRDTIAQMRMAVAVEMMKLDDEKHAISSAEYGMRLSFCKGKLQVIKELELRDKLNENK